MLPRNKEWNLTIPDESTEPGDTTQVIVKPGVKEIQNTEESKGNKGHKASNKEQSV